MAEFGRGFAEKNLRRMMQFAEVFPDPLIVAALLRQLGWTHFTLLIPIRDGLKRDFYAEMCRVERWSTRTLRQKIDSMLFERTALSKKPDQLIRAGTRCTAGGRYADARSRFSRSLPTGFSRAKRHL